MYQMKMGRNHRTARSVKVTRWLNHRAIHLLIMLSTRLAILLTVNRNAGCGHCKAR